MDSNYQSTPNDTTIEDGPTPMSSQSRPSWDDTPDVEPSRANLVKDWVDQIKQAKKHWAKTFKRMRDCQQLAVHGGPKAWVEGDSYTVPIIPRYINQAVASLYAKDPRAEAKRRQKLMYQIWDEDPRSIAAAIQGAQMGDPNSMQLLQELVQVAQYNRMVDNLGKTLEVCWDYFTGAQSHGFKQEMKALVRRTKINGVAYAKLCFQRALQPNPEILAEMTDVTDKIAKIEAQMREFADGDLLEDDGELAEMKASLADLQAQQMMVVREGPVFDWPKSTEIIPDPNTRHLKTWGGTNWVAHEFSMKPRKVLEVYKIDLGNNFTKYYGINDFGERRRIGDTDEVECLIWEVHDKTTQMVFTICEGYPDFLKEPAAPDVYVPGFWTIFPLVMNEVESDDDIFPPSDVWLIRHPQQEINRMRQGIREHRMANRPKYVFAAGSIEEDDQDKIESAPAHTMIPINGLTPGEDIAKKVQRFPNIGIDPNQYEVETTYQDILRSVGAQEADLGGTSNNTATESSIAEHARMTTLADNVDELDDFLSVLAQNVGYVMLRELSKDTVTQIAGPGAVWPEMQPTREQIAEDLYLEIRAGSSGRPNKAAEIANIERAVPYLIQLPGINPEPIAAKYSNLLDIDIDELYVPNLPSIVAQNALNGRGGPQPPAPAHPGQDPNQQGAQGHTNAPNPRANEPGPQPGYNAPTPPGAHPGQVA